MVLVLMLAFQLGTQQPSVAPTIETIEPSRQGTVAFRFKLNQIF